MKFEHPLGVGWPIAWKDNRCGVRKKHNQRDKDIRLQLRGTLKDIKQTYRITFYVLEPERRSNRGRIGSMLG